MTTLDSRYTETPPWPLHFKTSSMQDIIECLVPSSNFSGRQALAFGSPCLHAGAKLTHAAVCVQTLERSYLLRIDGRVVERPQHMLMRVSVGIHQQVGTPCRAQQLHVQQPTGSLVKARLKLPDLAQCSIPLSYL